MTTVQFIGAWKLVSTEFRDADGNPHHPYGQNPSGILMYDANGYMSSQIMRIDRPRLSANSVLRATGAEIRATVEGYDAYFGTYDVDPAKGTITHHVEGSLLPHWHGTDQTRFYEFSDDRLTLRTPPQRFGAVLSGTFVWERVSREDDGQVAIFQDSGEPETVIWTLGHYNKRTQFSYDGNVNVGVTLRFKANLFISAQFFHSILEHFTGKTVEGGFSITNSPRGGFGYWVAENSSELNGIRLTPRHASFIAAILAHEGFITSSLDGNSVMLHFPAAE